MVKLQALCAAVVVSLAMAACGSSGGGGGDLTVSPDLADAVDAAPFSGDARVTWKNLDPRHPDVTQTLVNESSEPGRLLMSGKASSTSIRVMTDEEMGRLLATLAEEGFFEHATAGMNTKNLPDIGEKKGIVVVERDGESHGLMLTRNLGNTPIPRVYQKCKAWVLGTHGQIRGLEVRVNADDRVFEAGGIKSPLRR